MKLCLCALVFILMSSISRCQDDVRCSLESTVEKRKIPDIIILAPKMFRMEVEQNIPNLNQTRHYTTYYDESVKKAVIYAPRDGRTTKYHYFSDGRLEAFEIIGTTCTEYDMDNMTKVPEFMRNFAYEWAFDDLDGEGVRLTIHGPSAMLEYVMSSEIRNADSVRYMGNSTEDVRGVPAHYWRRCLRENLSVDYYFAVAAYEDVFGAEGLKDFPLRIVYHGIDDRIPEESKNILPQIYEILSFAPFDQDPLYRIELPVGLGCRRKQLEGDAHIPSFEKSDLFVLAEAVYTDSSSSPETLDISNFMYAVDVASGFASYSYTPWSGSDDNAEAAHSRLVVFDTNNTYVYERNVGGTCEIRTVENYIPQYTLPGDNGYISLTGSSIFHPGNEFHYLGEGVEQGCKVNIFEAAYPDGYSLGDRVVKNTVVTYYYLKDNQTKPDHVKNALARIRIAFDGDTDKGNTMKAVLNLNFYAFGTQVEFKDGNFNISNAVKNDDEYVLLTIGFPPVDSLRKQIADQMPDVEQNMREHLITNTGVAPDRLPRVKIDLREGISASFPVRKSSPGQLDDDVSHEDCTPPCLEHDLECWGSAHCGDTCYVATGEGMKSELRSKPGCHYKGEAFDSVPRLQVVKRNLERLVETGQIRLAVQDREGKEVFLTANRIRQAAFGESEEIFNTTGHQPTPGE